VPGAGMEPTPPAGPRIVSRIEAVSGMARNRSTTRANAFSDSPLTVISRNRKEPQRSARNRTRWDQLGSVSRDWRRKSTAMRCSHRSTTARTVTTPRDSAKIFEGRRRRDARAGCRCLSGQRRTTWTSSRVSPLTVTV